MNSRIISFPNAETGKKIVQHIRRISRPDRRAQALGRGPDRVCQQNQVLVTSCVFRLASSVQKRQRLLVRHDIAFGRFAGVGRRDLRLQLRDDRPLQLVEPFAGLRRDVQSIAAPEVAFGVEGEKVRG